MMKETRTATVIAGCNHQRSVRSVRSLIDARVAEKTPVATIEPLPELHNFPPAGKGFLGEVL
jgi:hypothetical protein